MNVAVLDRVDYDTVERCAQVYATVFSEAPYFEGPEHVDALRDRLERHAAREGFGLAIARVGETVAGFGLVVSARPGDWWRDRAAEALTPDERDRWLGERCTEIVHVAVAPDCRRQGLGRRLLAAMLHHARNPTAVLSCHPAATAAQRLYLDSGWNLLVRDFKTQPGQLGYWLLARDHEMLAGGADD